ncbi:Ankyrin repeat domain containing protein, partial [Asbolus verrucosus]
TYTATKGVENEGYDFEVAMLTLYSFQLCYNDDVRNFKLAIYDDHFRPFDDIVVNVVTDIEETYAFQLKHVKDKLQLNSSHFAKNGKLVLNKYFKFDFARSNHVVLLTNGIVNEEVNVGSFNITPKPSISPLEKMLDTSVQEGYHIYEISSNDGSDKITFFTSQMNCHDIETLVVNKFKEKFSINDNNLRNIFQKFKDFFQTWKKSCFGHCKLDKEDIKMKISEILFYDHIAEYCPTFGDVDETTKLLHNVLNQFNITIMRELYEDVIVNLCHFDVDKNQVAEHAKEFLIISNDSSKDIAIILWRLKKFPLIVKVDDDNKKMVYELITDLRKENFSFIFISEDVSRTEFKEEKVFECLKDLGNDTKITENLKLSIQGRTKVALKKLIKCNPQFSEIISVGEIILMLKGNFLVGEPEEILPQPYISRHLLTSMLKIESIEQNPNDLFLVNGSESDQKSLKSKLTKRKYYMLDEYENIVSNDDKFPPKSVILTEKDIKNPLQVCLKNKNKNAHYLKIIGDDRLQWICSKTKTEELWRHRVVLTENQLHANLKNNINLICSRPGMGKLTLLKYLKNNCPPGYWTVKVNFQEHQNDTKENHTFECKMKQCFEKARRVIYFFYGIDNLQDDNLKKAIDVIKQTSDEGFKVWVFSEDHLREELEKNFAVASMDIEEFDEDQQRQYIRGRLNDEQIDQGLEKILMSFKMLKNNNILGAPMHLYMLTEIFIKNPKQNMEEIFILTDIYQYFIKTKYNQYLSKCKCDDNSIVSDGIHYRTEQYKLAAMSSKYFEGFRLQCDSYFLTQITRIGDILGIISKVNADGTVIFSQQTYADYFAALWLANNFRKIETLKNFIFREEFKNILFMFNLELTKHNPAHVAVLYQNHDQLLKHQDKFEDFDQVRRTPLHIACSYGMKYPKLEVISEGEVYRFSDIKENAEVLKIIDYLLENIKLDPLQADQLFGWNLFDYACHTLNLYAIEKLLTKEVAANCLHRLENGDKFSTLYYCVKLGYTNLLRLIVNEESFKKTINTKNYNDETLLHLAVNSNSYSIVNILLDSGIATDTVTNTHYKRSALHLAAENGYVDIMELLLRKGASINIMDRYRNTPLHICAARGDFRSAELLVTCKADVNSSDNFGQSPLHLAASNGHTSIVVLLLDHGADVNHSDKLLGKTPLDCAKNKKMEKLLVNRGAETTYNATAPRKSLTSEYDSYKKFPLHWAAGTGQTEDIERLLKEGWCVNDPDEYGRIPLHRALKKGHSDVAQILVNKGAIIDIPDKEQITPLCWAINNEDLKIIDLLINNNARIDVVDSFGYSPLHWAVMQKNPEIVSLLLSKTPNLDVIDKIGMTPLDWAVELGHPKIVRLLNEDVDDELLEAAEKKFEFLASYRSISHHVDNDPRFSPFHDAVHSGKVDLVKKFLSKGDDVDETDQFGCTALHRSVIKQDKQIVKLLLKNSASINAANNINSTPLHWAAYNGNAEILRVLLDHKPQIDVLDHFGFSPLQLAVMKEHHEAVSMLIASGGNLNVVDECGNTLLDCACKMGHINTVDVLIRNNAVAKIIHGDYLKIARRQNTFFKYLEFNPFY